eukprot:TRINITY_DN3795_c0_g1_i16.p1 TRINITY_DN3795_c0_g1~~TRINITY_DN3795_c0_g1_i16.p1  ORF type:complete len:421 (-),score=98.82 TRINITY_DN3795_c0_g1_i16:198-1460(-)
MRAKTKLIGWDDGTGYLEERRSRLLRTFYPYFHFSPPPTFFFYLISIFYGFLYLFENREGLGLTDLPLVAAFNDGASSLPEEISQQWHDGIVNDDAGDDGGGTRLVHEKALRNEKEISKALQMIDGDDGNEFTYFNEKALENWAGPVHWKFKRNPPEGQVEESKEVKTKTMRTRATKRKAQFFIDFTSPSKKKKEEIEKLLQPGEKTTLSNSTINQQIKLAHTLLLPTDVHFDISEFTKLFNQPLWHVPTWNERKKWDSMPAINENPLQVKDEDGQEDQNFHHLDSDSEDIPVNPHLDIPISGPLAMIDNPPPREKTTVKYATKANFVDVKALKHKMWKHICQADSQAPKSFQGILTEMPNHIPEHALSSISVPYYFICLLHLANENNLEILPSDETGDLEILRNVTSPTATASVNGDDE